MRSVPPSLPTRRRGDPVPIGELLGLALPRRVRGRMLDLDFLRTLWAQAVPDDLAERAFPARFEKGVLTILADDAPARIEAYRRRSEIARGLLRAAGLPGATLRVRVEVRGPGTPKGARPTERFGS